MNTDIIDDHYIVHWLRSNPDFFIRQGALLADLKLTSPYSHRAISLQERQLEVLREKVRGLELRLAELLRYGHDNSRIVGNLHRWMVDLLSNAPCAPDKLSAALCAAFGLPCAQLRLWEKDASPAWQHFTDNLVAPKCGPIELDPLLSEAAAWLGDAQIVSVALIPLRRFAGKNATHQDSGKIAPASLGLWVLGAYDKQRFSADMDTTYLCQIGELASVALTAAEQVCVS